MRKETSHENPNHLHVSINRSTAAGTAAQQLAAFQFEINQDAGAVSAATASNNPQDSVNKLIISSSYIQLKWDLEQCCGHQEPFPAPILVTISTRALERAPNVESLPRTLTDAVESSGRVNWLALSSLNFKYSLLFLPLPSSSLLFPPLPPPQSSSSSCQEFPESARGKIAIATATASFCHQLRDDCFYAAKRYEQPRDISK